MRSFREYTTESYLESTTQSFSGWRYAQKMSESPVKAAFSQRLRELCEDAGLPEHGRQTALAKRFGVSQQAAKKWLSGESLPELEKMILIATWAGVNFNWLAQGTLPKKADYADTKAHVLSEAIDNLPADSRQQVLDFISYKIERADGLFTAERMARYMTMLDSFKATPKKE